MSDYREDVLAIMAACVHEDWEGLTVFLSRMGLQPGTRVGDIVSGMAGFAYGTALNAYKAQGLSQEEAREQTRLLIAEMVRKAGT